RTHHHQKGQKGPHSSSLQTPQTSTQRRLCLSPRKTSQNFMRRTHATPLLIPLDDAPAMKLAKALQHAQLVPHLKLFQTNHALVRLALRVHAILLSGGVSGHCGNGREGRRGTHIARAGAGAETAVVMAEGGGGGWMLRGGGGRRGRRR